MKYNLAECQDMNAFSGLFLIIGDFSYVFYEILWKIFQDFVRFLKDLGDFFKFLGISLDF